MKRVALSIIISILCFSFVAAQEQTHYATCKVIEKDKKVKVEFSQDVKFLGVDYEKTVMYFDKKKLSFTDGNEVVSYLSASWGWVLCGNPVNLKDKGTMWTMKHEVDKNIVNFTRNLRALEEGERRYTKKQDEVYYDLDNYSR